MPDILFKEINRMKHKLNINSRLKWQHMDEGAIEGIADTQVAYPTFQHELVCVQKTLVY